MNTNSIFNVALSMSASSSRYSLQVFLGVHPVAPACK